MAKQNLVLLSVACALLLCEGRIRRNGENVIDDKPRRDLNEDSSKHTYYVLIKQNGRKSLQSAEDLSQDFTKRLGEDNKVRVSAASKDKLVVEINGDAAFADKIVDAVKSFPESEWVEKKPVFQTRAIGGRRGTIIPPPQAANM